MDNDLTIGDLNILIEATESWENKDFAGEMMGDLLGMMLTDKDPESKNKYMVEKEERDRKYKMEKQGRKEKSVILRSKLLFLRNELMSKTSQPTRRLHDDRQRLALSVLSLQACAGGYERSSGWSDYPAFLHPAGCHGLDAMRIRMFSDGMECLRWILRYADRKKEDRMSMTESDWLGVEAQRRHDMGECLDNPGSVCPICEDEEQEEKDKEALNGK